MWRANLQSAAPRHSLSGTLTHRPRTLGFTLHLTYEQHALELRHWFYPKGNTIITLGPTSRQVGRNNLLAHADRFSRFRYIWKDCIAVACGLCVRCVRGTGVSAGSLPEAGSPWTIFFTPTLLYKAMFPMYSIYVR